jgi:hypothetical protein
MENEAPPPELVDVSKCLLEITLLCTDKSEHLCDIFFLIFGEKDISTTMSKRGISTTKYQNSGCAKKLYFAFQVFILPVPILANLKIFMLKCRD